MFSPSVSLPFTFMPGIGLKAEYWPASWPARCWNFASSPAVHQSRSAPSPSNLRPWSSKPWLTSWPMTAPMPP